MTIGGARHEARVNAPQAQSIGEPDREQDARERVWCALSELFLDTDVTLADNFVVRELAASPFTIGELERILEREVAPVCMWNVLWWEWAGFDREWLAARIRSKLARPSLLRWLPLPGKHGLGPPGHWATLKRRVEAARSTAI